MICQLRASLRKSIYIEKKVKKKYVVDPVKGKFSIDTWIHIESE